MTSYRSCVICGRPDAFAIERAIQEGKPHQDIASEFGLRLSTVSRHFRHSADKEKLLLPDAAEIERRKEAARKRELTGKRLRDVVLLSRDWN